MELPHLLENMCCFPLLVPPILKGAHVNGGGAFCTSDGGTSHGPHELGVEGSCEWKGPRDQRSLPVGWFSFLEGSLFLIAIGLDL